ncbi:hypothetical protein [Paracoccus ravus]|uniref:hypothetical protein n=1 Tax=Paracoccus ravus TaxID=2447760 RepID=UPI00106EEFEC|nr:hypothetical protein [Paracoccus ravus]
MTEGILALLDSRSFGSIWFWLVLALVWSLAGRRIAGVPFDIAQKARHLPKDGPDDPAAILLLDWLSLTLPRWVIGRPEALLLLFAATFVLSALVILGFVYGLEMAQALALLILPFAALLPLEIRLAHRLSLLVEAAVRGDLSLNGAAGQASRLMSRHRALITGLSILVVAVTAYRAALWFLDHPFGF